MREAIFWFVAGVAVGWIVFERPQLVSDAIAWAKSKLGHS